MGDRKAELRDGLARERRYFLDAVAALGEEGLARSAGDASDWTCKDLIGHVAFAEGGMIPLARVGAGDPAPQLPEGFDIDRWNESRLRRARREEVPQLLERLAASREQLLAVLDTLGDADFDRPVSHPTQGATTVAGIFQIIAWHEHLHAEELWAAAKG